MAYVYRKFIPQNTAPKGAKSIGVYNNNGKKVANIPLFSLTPPTENKLYSFCALSDIHLTYDTANADFQRALTYAATNCDFTVIDGDLTSTGADSEMALYKSIVDNYAQGKPVYAISGNHETSLGVYVTNEKISPYTGNGLYYSFTKGNDVFIMLGYYGAYHEGNGGWRSNEFISVAELQWLYETLEANRNQRCFVFQHVRPQDGCGNTVGIYSLDIWGGTEQKVFESLMRHYKNAHHFHGHSHLKFYLQYGSDVANIDHLFGGWSIHIPSLAVPRDGDASGASSRKEIYADSEGYVVDVYKNGIHLRGRDFVKGEFLPIASYWLDTTLQNVEANTYTDSTGTIT